jgi:hypothetical protein
MTDSGGLDELSEERLAEGRALLKQVRGELGVILDLPFSLVVELPDSVPHYKSPVADVRDRALQVGGWPPALPHAEGAVGRDDGYGMAVIAKFGLIEDWPTGLAALLEHCATARPARPGPRWEKVCRQRLDAVADATGVLRTMLGLVATAEPVTYIDHSTRETLLIRYNERLVKGLVWAAGILDPDWLPDVLPEVAIRCLRLCSGRMYRRPQVPAEKIPYACFRALAASRSEASLRALMLIGRATANRRPGPTA